jgi:hypothetical protein
VSILDSLFDYRGVFQEGPCTWRHGAIAAMRKKAIVFFDDASEKEVFIPISRILDWQFTKDKTKKHLRVQDLERHDEVSLYIPVWLAKREKLIIE